MGLGPRAEFVERGAPGAGVPLFAQTVFGRRHFVGHEVADALADLEDIRGQCEIDRHQSSNSAPRSPHDFRPIAPGPRASRRRRGAIPRPARTGGSPALAAPILADRPPPTFRPL